MRGLPPTSRAYFIYSTMSHTPIKISVIVPVYNAAAYLATCLDSIFGQTLTEIEVICVEDGSTDGSLSILQKYVQKESRLIVLTQANKGPGYARNTAIAQAKGEYIAFVDADDYIDKTLFEKAYRLARQQQADVVQFNYTEYREITGKYKEIDLAKKLQKEYGYQLRKNGFYNKQIISQGLFYNLYNQVWNRIYRRDFIVAHQIHFSTSHNAEDHLFTIGVLLFADKIYCLNESLYTYRVRMGSACHTWSEQDIVWTYQNIAQLKAYLQQQDLYERYQQEFDRYCARVLYWVRLKLEPSQWQSYDQQVQSSLPQESFAIYTRLCEKPSFWRRLLGRRKQR